MQNELFEFVDEGIVALRTYRNIFDQIARKTVKSLKNSLFQYDNFMNVSYRIKSEKSFKEKIIKNNFYLEYEDVNSMIMNMSDLIGIRIECRFIKDETEIYELIKKTYNIDQGNGYFKNDENSPISLKLSDRQPQIQNNGFEIYKIDCKYKYGKNHFNFELQIKSMVNVFWGEIDHKILYKNYNYMIDEKFFREIMATIKDSLYMIDKQLLLLYEHVSNLDASAFVSANTQINHLLSKIIHDVYSEKIKNELGFVFNFKHCTDVIVEFLQLTAAKKKELSYGENFVKLINRINEISSDEISMRDNIKFEDTIKFSDKFTQNILDVIIYLSSRDFTWNLVLKIICQMENVSYYESTIDFLNFIRSKYSLLFIKYFDLFKYDFDEENEIEDYVLDIVYENFKKNKSLNYLVEDALKDIENEFIQLRLKDISYLSVDVLKLRFKKRMVDY